jgi:Txe/YoeB family toxin of Txe-Axe toxin-antitoxin module
MRQAKEGMEAQMASLSDELKLKRTENHKVAESLNELLKNVRPNPYA